MELDELEVSDLRPCPQSGRYAIPGARRGLVVHAQSWPYPPVARTTVAARTGPSPGVPNEGADDPVPSGDVSRSTRKTPITTGTPRLPAACRNARLISAPVASP